MGFPCTPNPPTPDPPHLTPSPISPLALPLLLALPPTHTLYVHLLTYEEEFN